MKKTLVTLLFAVAATTFLSTARGANSVQPASEISVLTPAPTDDFVPLDKATLQKAIQYIISSHSFRSWDITLYNNGGLVPSHFEFGTEQANEDHDWDREIVLGEVPIEERTINTEHLPETEGMENAIDLMEYLSANRMYLNFEELYKKYSPVIRLVVSKEDYKEEFQKYVEALLVTYPDISTNPDVKDMMNAILEAHLRETLENSGYPGLPFYYENIEGLVSEKVKKFREDYSKEYYTDYQKSYPIMWAYSFWLRRANEGNTQEVLNALKAVQKDYK